MMPGSLRVSVMPRLLGGTMPGSSTHRVGPNRKHKITTHVESENYIDPDTWQQSAIHHEGSWVALLARLAGEAFVGSDHAAADGCSEGL